MKYYKKIKRLHSSIVYRILKNLSNTGSILRRPGSVRKEKIEDEKYKNDYGNAESR